VQDIQEESVSEKATKVSLHIFPKDEELKKIWLRSIKRKDFVPSKHSRVCSRHFQESCFVLERQDSNNSRSKNNCLSSMKLAKLKPGAIQTIFPEAPSYLSSSIPERTTHCSTSQKR
ncbi:THAP domaincontaining protein 5like, partial [Caligus rogercresseyi]